MNRFFTLLFAASCLTAFGQVPDYVSTANLIGWWSFENELTDLSGNNNHGTGVGGLTYGAGLDASAALDLSSPDSYVHLEGLDNFDFSSQYPLRLCFFFCQTKILINEKIFYGCAPA